MAEKINLAYLVSHPIQYQAPLLREIAALPDVSLKVFFCSDFSVQQYVDDEFGHTVQWDTPLLEGYEYEFLPALGKRSQIGRFSPFVYGMTHRLKKGNFKALWVHGWFHWSHIWAILAAKHMGLRVFVRGETNLHTDTSGLLKSVVKERFLRWLFSKVDGFFAIGTWNREFYLHYGVAPEQIYHMPYTVDNYFFQSMGNKVSKNREEFRSSLGLEGGRPIILYASKLTKRKRAMDLLEAYGRLVSRVSPNPSPYLLFVGDGEWREVVQKRAIELGMTSVRFLGFKNQTELPAYYDICDIFVLPSENEPWGLVINEVMSIGRAVILVSDQVGCGVDLVRNGMNGFIFRTGDIHDLEQVLVKALKEVSSAKVTEANDEIIKNWSFDQCIAGLRKALHTGVPA